ncbi:MAG: S9 family peptidase [Blastocatellia bacterium]|nr:S9 family peptidase [Blastocatellia bacterium]
MKRLLYTCILLLVFVAVASAQEGGLRVEDLFRFNRVADPQVSPDGKTVAYVVSSYDKAANRRSSQIWLVSIDGGEARQLTSSQGVNDRPRWSPNGKQIAFVSTRDGEGQIWLLDVSGGEARKLTKLSTGARDMVWSPDGSHLLFTSEVYPECENDDCNNKRNQQVEASKVKAKVINHLLYRHWNFWKDGKRDHVFIVSANGGEAKDITPGNWDSPPFSLGGQDNYVFSPDGKEVCFARNTDEDEALSTNNDLFLVSANGGEAKRITEVNRGSDTHPLYSPDGRYIAYRSQERAGFEADRFRLMLYDRQSGRSKSISEKLDRSIENFVWSPDSKKIYFTSEDFGYSPIYSVDVQTENITLLIDKSSNSDLTITPDGKKLVFSRTSITLPSEVFVADIDTRSVKQLSNTNAELLSQRRFSPAEDIFSKGSDGAKVHSLLVKPVGFDPSKKYPMVVLIHGGPQGAWTHAFGYRWNPNIYASAGYVVLMPNPRGSTGYGQKFTDEISGDWGGKCYEDIVGAVDHVLEMGFVDKERVGAAGGSFGGYMVNWILGQNNPRFKALVSHAGVYNLTSMYGVTEELWFAEWEFKGTPWTNPELYAKFSPHNNAKNFKIPTLVIHGELDYRVPVGEGFQLFTALQRNKVPSRLLYFPDEGHWILKPQNSELWYTTVLDWFKQHLK